MDLLFQWSRTALITQFQLRNIFKPITVLSEASPANDVEYIFQR